MADTRHHGAHAGTAPVEGDGIHYGGIGWFIVILTVTTVFCQVLVWGIFELMASRADARDVAPPAIAGPSVTPRIEDGRLLGRPDRPGPDMLVYEPTALGRFRATEDELLATYGWVDRNAGTIRIPIERAKELLLEKGLAARER
jgi:hypothetical protein